jgi:hypothetical protein
MYSRMSLMFWATFFREFRCSNCGSDAGYPSRPRSFVEKYLAPILFLRKVRCGDCYRRFYRPVSIPLREKHKPLVVDYESAIHTLEAAPNKEPTEETEQPPSKRARIA